MVNSNLNQDSCMCVYGLPGPPMRTKQNQDSLTIRISISLGAVQENPTPRRSPLIRATSTVTFSYPRQAFLSATPEEQRDIICNIIQGLEIPFPLENLVWGLDFPDDETRSRHENLDGTPVVRLSEIALRCAENDRIGYMEVAIQKLVKLKPEKYQELCDMKIEPLDDWFLENLNSVNLLWCLKFIHKLRGEDGKYYGLKSVMVTSEREDCSICLEGLMKNSQAIRMPCSHIFHGFCIFKWLERRPHCPICREELALPTCLS